MGLQLSYLTWGIVQERVMTKEYLPGRFKSSTFLVFNNRLLALFLSLGIVAYKRLVASKSDNEPLKEAPLIQYAPSSLSNSISSWAQYEALKFVSFPTQVLSKSCKILPVMLVGVLVNKTTYPLIEYLDATLITIGVGLFTVAERTTPSVRPSPAHDTIYGIFLLLTYLICDSFTSQWQSRVLKKYQIDQYQMMLGINIWSCGLTALTLLQSGEGLLSIAFIIKDTSAFVDNIILSVTSAVGQLFIFYTIKEHGPVVFTIIMTTRQLFSLVLSCLLFGHMMTVLAAIGAALVFVVVFNKIKRKDPQQEKTNDK